ncbi:RGC/RGC protein kinase [Saprolegnia diclina VS20]|uniref:RGC/RGC protein kinase n=1 Tax=Saprolegnia diclina (strain VS20) TaxID=1156394 RepID=T0QA10_SAPDV|nr:RGC/RGC protein kinase [Saprolegnia diclina VS20]EQC30340.1 RGC/RGC protein kinase [Saprolegnia diclina VS20]|eukprot:XP_008616193.1 RGC/RGC protein kinase [Saprolegnia diclina VS20]
MTAARTTARAATECYNRTEPAAKRPTSVWCYDDGAMTVDIQAAGGIAIDASSWAAMNLSQLTINGHGLSWSFEPPANLTNVVALTLNGLSNVSSFESLQAPMASLFVLQNSTVTSLSLQNFTKLAYVNFVDVPNLEVATPFNVSAPPRAFISDAPRLNTTLWLPSNDSSNDHEQPKNRGNDNETVSPATAAADGSTMSALLVIAIILSVVAAFAFVVVAFVYLRRRRAASLPVSEHAMPAACDRLSTASSTGRKSSASALSDPSLSDPMLASFPDYLRLPAPTRMALVKPSRKLLQGVFEDRDVVIKYVSKDSPDVETFLSDLWHVSNLQHVNLVLFLGVASFPRLDDACVGAVVECMEKGSLATVLTNPKIVISDDIEWNMCMDVATAVQFVHGRGRSVPCLTSRKFLVNAEMQVKLNVLSLLTYSDLRLPDGHSFGSQRLAHKAPEVLRGDCMDEYAADVYSLGLLLAEICTRSRPFASELRDRGSVGVDVFLMDRAMNGTCAPDVLPYDVATQLGAYPAELQALLLRCWAWDACDRPSMDEVVAVLQIVYEDRYVI